MSSSAVRIRLFYALALPATMQQRLAKLIEGLRTNPSLEHPPPRWVSADNLHVTVQFLGMQPQTAVPALSKLALDLARKTTPPRIRLASIGAFPSLRRARTFVLHLSDPGSRLNGLRSALQDSLRTTGIDFDSRSFRPHITLARFKVPSRLSGFALPSIAVKVTRVS